MICTRCDGTGFLNIVKVDEKTLKTYASNHNINVILEWINKNKDHNVSICDCCGNGLDWHWIPGQI